MYIKRKEQLYPLSEEDLQTAITTNSKLMSKKIKRLRIEKELNLDDFSALCGIARTTLAQLENHEYFERSPNLSTLTRVAMGLDVSIYDLFKD